MRKVVKFGGSSLASAQQFEKVAEIVHAEASRRYVVPSAPGKRFRKDTKVTDMLYGCYALAEQDEDFSENLHQIEERYQEIIDGLSLTLSLEDEFAVIEKNFRAHAGKDYAASRGEYLNLSLIHISEPTRLGMISYAVFCLKKKKYKHIRAHKKIN